MGRLNGKVALISGAARGMGASHARHFIDEGAKVVIGDILDDQGAGLADELGEAATFVHLDVRHPDGWQAAVATAVSKYGKLDVLVNNAGIVRVGDIETHSLDEWQLMLDINLTGVFLGMKSSVTEMKKTGNASIINISSIAGLQGFGGMSSYNATKFAVRGLTKSAALDLGPFNIRVNSVHPGLIKTPMTEGANMAQDHVAMHRPAEAAEVSRLLVFLASDESSFSTGSEFVIDGGETAGLSSNAVFG